MNTFDQRWQACAKRARQTVEADDAVPYGFAARVTARWRARQTPSSADAVWERLSLRALTLATAILLICTAIELRPTHANSSWVPHIEDTVAQEFWLL